MPRLPINYNNTVMYKIVCNDLNIKDLYVGHTCDFIRRKSKHKYSCTRENNPDYNYKLYIIIRKNGGWDNWSMVEIEKFSCKDANEARKRERYWYELLNANLNGQHPARTRSETLQSYNDKNKEKVRESKSRYYINNKQKILEDTEQRRNLDYICCCGTKVKQGSKYNHLNSNKHFELLEKLKNNI